MQNKENYDKNGINSFLEIYEQAIIESLLIFGHHFAGIISLHLKEKYSITRIGDTISNPKILSDAMESLMDDSAKVIQRRILRLIYQEIGIKFPFYFTINFEDEILNAKKEFDRRYPRYLN